jgi:hypothetical protein
MACYAGELSHAGMPGRLPPDRTGAGDRGPPPSCDRAGQTRPAIHAVIRPGRRAARPSSSTASSAGRPAPAASPAASTPAHRRRPARQPGSPARSRTAVGVGPSWRIPFLGLPSSVVAVGRSPAGDKDTAAMGRRSLPPGGMGGDDRTSCPGLDARPRRREQGRAPRACPIAFIPCYWPICTIVQRDQLPPEVQVERPRHIPARASRGRGRWPRLIACSFGGVGCSPGIVGPGRSGWCVFRFHWSRLRRTGSSEVGEGFADGDAGGAGGCCVGGECCAENGECGPDAGGEDGDPVGQWCGEEEVAEPVA